MYQKNNAKLTPLATTERAQIQCVMQSPCRSRGTGLTHNTAVDQTHWPASQKIIGSHGKRHVRRHLLNHPLKPRPTTAQPLQQRDIRYVRQITSARTNGSFAQRAPIRQVNQHDAKHRLDAFKTAQPSHRAQFLGLALPIGWQHACHHVPVLLNTGDFSRK